MSLSAEQRSVRASIGGHTRAGKYDGHEITAKARAGFRQRFLKQVDATSPDLPEPERQRRADHLLKAHMQRLALASSRARARKAQAS
jgi:hypothetical protein